MFALLKIWIYPKVPDRRQMYEGYNGGWGASSGKKTINKTIIVNSEFKVCERANDLWKILIWRVMKFFYDTIFLTFSARIVRNALFYSAGA